MSHGFSEEFIRFLKQPESYPHKPDNVEHIQTHISHVFIAPPYVYKFKKQVNFEFLDFSSLDKRKHYCEQEVRLNQRMCGDTYIDVVPVYKTGDTWTFDESAGQQPFEYAVWMKQLSGKDFLIEDVRNGTLSLSQIDRVISKLVPFYEQQSPETNVLEWGSPEKIKINTDENFEQTKAFIGDSIDGAAYNTIQTFTGRYLNQYQSLFEKRISQGRIVDGHGDLHLEHIHLTKNRVCIYDCIEFNDRFRYLDIASDIAFLAMDLDFNGYKNESNYLVQQMSDKLDDPGLMRLADFYKCYRAYIRGKVKSMESREEEVGATGRKQASRLARNYFSLALKYAVTGSKPTILVFMGRIASGKSTLAEEVAARLDIEHFSSDVIRKESAGLPIDVRTPSEKRKDLYHKESTIKTYEAMFTKAKNDVGKGKNVVLDATFGKRNLREQLLSFFDDTESTIRFIEAQAPEEVRKKRLAKRSDKNKIISDARLEDFEMLNQNYEEPSDGELTERIHIDSDQPIEKNLHEIFLKLSDLQHFRQKSQE